MCLLTYFEPGADARIEELLAGAAVNNDGHGFAIWAEKGKFITWKGVDGPHVVRQFTRLRTIYKEGPAIFHSRWITSGSDGIHNVQPFRVPRVGVMAHNGTLENVYLENGMSDSRLWAETVMPRLEGMSTGQMQENLARWLSVRGAGNRMAFITESGDGILTGDWNKDHNHGGVWYSNNDYVPVVGKYEDAHSKVHLLYRMLADMQLAGDEEAGMLRKALLEVYPQLAHGTGKGNGLCGR